MIAITSVLCTCISLLFVALEAHLHSCVFSSDLSIVSYDHLEFTFMTGVLRWDILGQLIDRWWVHFGFQIELRFVLNSRHHSSYLAVLWNWEGKKTLTMVLRISLPKINSLLLITRAIVLYKL